jgi:hypothetical protein
MADTSLVEAAIVQLLGGVLYPQGPSGGSLIGAGVNIERGWPTEADIQAAVKVGMVLVRVHGVLGLSHDVTRYSRTWLEDAQGAITLTVSIVGTVVTFGGVPQAGQFIGVSSVAYAVLVSDTLSSIATALAGLIAGASASGPHLTLPKISTVTLGISGKASLEVARERQYFQICVWAPTPALRDSVMQLLYPNVAYTYRLPLVDGSLATLMDLEATGPDDSALKAGEWRRDFRVAYDYPVTLTQTFAPVAIATQTTVEG